MTEINENEQTGFQETTKFSTEIGKLAEALSKVQGVMEAAKETSTNPFFKSKYADLSAVWDVCRKPLSDNGLAVMQTVDDVRGKLYLVTILAHSSGQWVRSMLPIESAKAGPQETGKAITYARRYALTAMIGITSTEVDDDGEESMKSQRKSITKEQIMEIESQLHGEPERIQKMLQWLGVESIEKMNYDQYKKAKALIESKKNKA